MTIQDAYDQYQIMPQLQLHQYRVAAVAQLLAESAFCFSSAEMKDIVLVCLLHDMGNILKFDLKKFPDFLEPHGFGYWQSVQEDFRRRYGDDETEATLVIARELGVSERVLELIESIGFVNLEEMNESSDLAKKICEYADCRVAPTGVVSLEERLADFARRYSAFYSTQEDELRRKRFREVILEIETDIFKESNLIPSDITDKSILFIFDELSQYEIKS